MPLLHPPGLPRFLVCLEGTREDPVLWLIELARALPVRSTSASTGSRGMPAREYTVFTSLSTVSTMARTKSVRSSQITSTMGVAAEILHDVFGATEGALQVHHPMLSKQGP